MERTYLRAYLPGTLLTYLPKEVFLPTYLGILDMLLHVSKKYNNAAVGGSQFI